MDRPLNKTEIESLARLLDYLEDMEKTHYEESECCSNHIYTDVLRLKSAMDMN